MSPEKTAFLFSGQGSQYAGMGVSLVEAYPELKKIFDEASEILGFDLYDKCANAPAEELAQTAISQPAIMAVSLCAAEALRINGITATAAAGHSLGEYAAMVYTGMVSRTDGFKLIKARSLAMQKAAENSSGAMFAIIGSTPADIEKVCAETEGYVVPVNYNSSVQTVIAGEEAAAQAAADTLAAAGARAIRLNVAAAFHSKLMQGAADEFKPAAEQISFKTPEITMLSNISGTVLDSIDGLGEKTPVGCVLAAEKSSGHEQILCTGGADGAGDKAGGAGIGHETDVYKGKCALGGLRNDLEITGQRQ